MIIRREAYSSFEFLRHCNIKGAPETLEIASADGNLNVLHDLPHQGFAVVGSRSPQRKSVRFVEQTLAELRHSRLVVISGFAKGIDSVAHECAIQNGLRTVAFIGSGIQVDYPKENRALKQRILESGGILISAFESESPPLARNFHLRNGLIAAFSKAVWVVEAAHGSGTLNTASWASSLNRDLYATPAFPGDPDYQGNEKLLGEKDTLKNPLAKAFYGIHSLGATWMSLEPQRSFTFQVNDQDLSLLQRWVKEIKSDAGECLIQNLMDYALTHGKSPGEFFKLYQHECNLGNLIEDPHGRVDYRLSGQVF